MIKAVVFDLDDTLIKEVDYIKSGFDVVSTSISKNYDLDKELVLKDMFELFDESSSYVYNRVLDKNNVLYSKQEIMNLVEIYRNHTPQIRLSKKVIKVLEELRSKGYKIGVITDGYKESQRKKIEALNLEKHVDKIIVTDELGKEYWKPHPRPFELMREKLDVCFHEMVYIGDNPQKDFYINKIYPIKTIRFYSSGIYKDDGYYKEVKENYRIKDLTEIIRLLGEIT